MARADPSRSGEIAAEQAWCPACDLKHVRQPDWLCPQCGMPVETEAWRSTVRSRSDEPERAPEFPLGSFVAGALLGATSLVLAVGFARNPAVEQRWPLVAVMVLLAVLALELLFKVSAARWIVVALAALALVVGTEDLVRARWPALMSDPLAPALRSALHGVVSAPGLLRDLFASGLLVGALLLVIGRPGRGRMVAGTVLAAALAVGELVRWLLP